MKTHPTMLVDTNVWLDCYLPSRTHHRSARAFLQAALVHEVDLLVSIGTVKDVYYLMDAQVKRQLRARKQKDSQSEAPSPITESEAATAKQLAQGYLANMLDLADVVGADASDVWLARKFQTLHPDFEDDLVIAAAHRCKADYVVTNDRQFIANSPVATISTQDAVKILAM